MGSQASRPSVMAAAQKAKSAVAENPVVVFSKSYCPYCISLKNLMAKLGVKAKVFELDQQSDGSDVQAALQEWTGQRTVPNVFIGGKHVGGNDDTVALHSANKLVPMLKAAGAL
eukprot:jgi/Chlat1/8135/Chrsp75S07564